MFPSAAADPAAPFPLTSPAWRPGVTLKGGEYVDSANGKHRLIMQTDGNLVLYQNIKSKSPQDTGVPVWSSLTQGNRGAYAKMQTDGNLVVYAPNGRDLWHSHTFNHTGASLIMTDDGSALILDWQPTWSSKYGIP